MADAEPSSEREILAREEQQLDFVMSVGIVKECELSMPYRAQLTGDKSNLFLLRVPEFEDILLDFLEEREDVREGIEVNVYDRGGHEFQMMLRKCEGNGNVFYALNRGWLNFLDQHCLRENDFISLRTFRHTFNHKLSFVVTYTKMQHASCMAL
ncbi:hypothetical protein JHK87_001781 [Glycine soja]|nr:hypothetical protein JHK87_001781 [Glycine soja]